LSRQCYEAAEVGDWLQGMGRLESTIEPMSRLRLPVFEIYTSLSPFIVISISLPSDPHVSVSFHHDLTA
nr:hypothetical protein [Tanacetum cinerariifolium]